MESKQRGPDSDEVAKDPGALTSHPSYTDKDFEGHRALTVYCTYGFQMPTTYRRRGHHRRHKHHKNGNKKKDERDEPNDGTPNDDNLKHIRPADRVQFILGEDDMDGTHESHPLFSELEELCINGEDVEWRETARWIKFEEDVEEGGDRWSKPHVATISLHSLFELRSCILNGTVMLDLEGSSLDQIADLVLENMVNCGQLSIDIKNKVKEALLRRHRHQHEKRHDKSDSKNRLPLIRSLADIGRNSSKSMFGSHTGNNHDGIPTSPSVTSLHLHAGNQAGNSASTGQLLADTNASSSTDLQHKLNQAFMRKIPPGSEADNILVGEIDFLEHTISGFVRLSQACHLGDLTEVPVPTRFLFILLGPHSIPGRYHEVGRAMATLMSDEVFHDVAYKAKNREDLLAGVDEFLDAVTILPPGAWDPNIRIEPPQQLPSQESRKKHDGQQEHKLDEEDEEEREREAMGLKRTGRLFGGLINDVRRKLPWYWSDFRDALVLQSIASIFFLYFACLTPIITFGGLLGDATGNNIATMESLMSGLICGLLYGFFSGQPLTILGSTGPVLIFETILYDFCRTHDFHYLNIRLWIGLSMAVILLVMVAVDASALVCYITRFTEENFATLISVIFIYKAIDNLIQIRNEYPINPNPNQILNYSCFCSFNNQTEYLIQEVSHNETEIKKCKSSGGEPIGIGCSVPNYVPDVFLLSAILFAGTYVISFMLKEFKTSTFFPTKLRQIVSDFSVPIAIGAMTSIDFMIGVNTPKLFVPDKFNPTRDDRGWIVPWIHHKNPWYILVLTPLPALLATILIFMDQQITAVIINRKEYKLKKGGGYHLDLFVLCILIAICSIMGLPWFVAATVLSMTHVNSLKMESECSAPGEKPQFLGVRENRVTHICIFTLIGMSVFFTKVLQKIPMPVLFGVFFYMGTSSLKGSQFFDRILIMFMPQKYQPDYTFLRHVPTFKVHVFTVIQLICFVILWCVKSYKKTAIGFPLMLVVIIFIRKLLDLFFTRNELKLLDDIMPEHTKQKREEEKREKEAEKEMRSGALIPNASSGNVAIPLANGNILKIPMENFNDEEDKPCTINITEQLAKSGAWKSIVDQSLQKLSKSTKSNSGNKKRGNKKDAKTEEEQKRLSTMREEDDEEDCGITIRVDAPTPVPSIVASNHNSPKDDRNETSIFQ
ncbi:electroneutral sodium bicarbonate exchanger 1-like isoform X2 [Oppia nitens]|uniref:electroneutral sodium bicarbonate exchanger 1-like isoform X2 n=1 Tax=Oppia nitens TaxID=1686743 RepID=UPI0023DA4912|nr:electroneutral sodium bicarbonate exchanger 1-like isoform X2 [Oppia nitens]